MLRTTTLPIILSDFVTVSDRSHCDFVLYSARRGKMTDGPSAPTSTLTIEFIGKLVSVDQTKLDLSL